MGPNFPKYFFPFNATYTLTQFTKLESNVKSHQINHIINKFSYISKTT